MNPEDMCAGCNAVGKMMLCIVVSILTIALPSECQTLIGAPSSATQPAPFESTIYVVCMSSDSSVSVQNLKWYGPRNYFDPVVVQSESNLIRTRDLMPRDPTTLDISRIYVQLNHDGSLGLNIQNLQSVDAGLYSCRGKVGGTDSTFSFTLQPYQPLAIQAKTNQYLVQGNAFSLIQCIVQGTSPQVYWQKDGVDVLQVPGARGRYQYDSSGLLVYTPSPFDRGRYTCRAVLPLAGTAQQVDIIVDLYTTPVMLSAPQVLNPNGFGVVRHDVVINCNATGYPDVQFRWFVGTATAVGNEVTDISFGTRFRPDGATGNLNILDLRLEDQSFYWCMAYNLAGSVKSVTFLNVTMIAYFSWNQNSTDKNQNETITLTCQSKAVPPADMKWWKWGNAQPYTDGVQANDPRIKVYQKFAAPTEELQQNLPKEVWIEITNAQPLDMANYTCIAVNIAGRNETTQEIRVNFRPVFVNTSDKVYNWEGNIRNLTCNTIAWPIPTWTWTYLGTVITNDAYHKIYYDYTNSSLEISVPYVSQLGSFWGKYTCKASNNRGDSFFDVSLAEAMLPDPPWNASVTRVTPTSVTLDCYLRPATTIPVILVEVRAEQPGSSSAPVPRRFDLGSIHHMVIDSLYPATYYTMRLTCRNEKGLGTYDLTYQVATLTMSKPYPILIISGSVSSYAGSHLIIWSTVDYGGSPISQFIVKWRQVLPPSGTWTVQQVASGISSFTVPNLKPNTQYEAQVLATNSLGTSDPAVPPYYFITQSGVVPTVILQQGNGPVPALIDLGFLQVYQVVIMAVVGLLLVFLAIDIVCCFTRECGIFMCIYSSASRQYDKTPVQALPSYEDNASEVHPEPEVGGTEMAATSKTSTTLFTLDSRVSSKDERDAPLPTSASRNECFQQQPPPRLPAAIGHRQACATSGVRERSPVPTAALSTSTSGSGAPAAAPTRQGYDNAAYLEVVRKQAYRNENNMSYEGRRPPPRCSASPQTVTVGYDDRLQPPWPFPLSGEALPPSAGVRGNVPSPAHYFNHGAAYFGSRSGRSASAAGSVASDDYNRGYDHAVQQQTGHASANLDVGETDVDAYEDMGSYNRQAVGTRKAPLRTISSSTEV